MTTTPSNTYIPGTCNIGPEEIKMRTRAGWTGFVVTILVGGLLVLVPVSPWVRLVLFFPATLAALGFFQSAFHFCVAFGMQGLFNVDHEVGKTESVSQQAYRKADKHTATQILIYSVAVGILVALVGVYI